MERKINRKSQAKTVKLDTPEAQKAEHMRLLHKHLLWAAEHTAAIYNLIKPADAPDINDPNQLKLFDDDTARV